MSETDAWYFIKNWVKTSDPKGEIGKRINVPFPNWVEIFPGFLRHLQDQLQEYQITKSCRVTLAPKSRQMMGSWIMCAFGLWVMLFYPESEVLFQSKKEGDSKKQIIRFKTLYESMPKIFKNKFPLSTSKMSAQHSCFLRLTNGSSVEGVASGGDVVRSRTPTLLISDESAFQDDLREVVKAGMACSQLFVLISSMDSGEFQRLVEDTDGEDHNISSSPSQGWDSSNQNERDVPTGTEAGCNNGENLIQPVAPKREWRMVERIL